MVLTERATRLAPHRRRWGRLMDSSPVALVGLAFVVLTLPPVIVTVVRSFFTTDGLGGLGHGTLDNYKGLFSQADLGQVLFNTTVTSLVATVLSLVIGGGLAWVSERTNSPGGKVCQFAMLTSLAIPYVLYTLAWLLLFAPAGPINAAAGMLGAEGPLVQPFSLYTLMLVEGLISAPLAYLLLAAVFRSMDPSLEESAGVAGASLIRTFLTVTGPLMRPGVIGIGLLVFIRTLEAFEVPALIGLPGNIKVMTTVIYEDTQVFPPDYGSAGAYAAVLMVLIIALLVVAQRLTRRSSAFATVTGKGSRPRVTDLKGKRYIGTVAIGVYTVVVLLAPLFIVVWASFMPYYRSPSKAALQLLTMSNYSAVLTGPTFLPSLRNTVIVGVSAATGIMILATVASWLTLKRRVRGGFLLDQMGTLPLVVPGVIMGFALIILYLPVPLPIYGTLLILIIGCLTRYLPYGLRYSSAGLLQVHTELDEAALVSGATRLRSLRTVLAPLALPALLAGWIFIFMVSTEELSMAVLLSSPGSQVLSVTLYQQYVNGQTTQAAALGTMWAIALGGVMMTLLWLVRRRGQTQLYV